MHKINLKLLSFKITIKDLNLLGKEKSIYLLQRCARLLRLLARRTWNTWQKQVHVFKSYANKTSHNYMYGTSQPEKTLHGEGRALIIVDPTTKTASLGGIAGLAVQSGFDFVHYRSRRTLYLSVKPGINFYS